MEIIFHHLSVIALLVPGEEKKMLLGTITHTPCLELIIGLHSLIFDQASMSSLERRAARASRRARAALGHCVRHCRPRWVDKGHQPDEPEIAPIP